MLAGVPTAAQALCASPYLDAHLFAFDDKLISAVQRPRPYSEQPLKFVSRAFPERSRFKARFHSLSRRVGNAMSGVYLSFCQRKSCFNNPGG